MFLKSWSLFTMMSSGFKAQVASELILFPPWAATPVSETFHSSSPCTQRSSLFKLIQLVFLSVSNTSISWMGWDESKFNWQFSPTDLIQGLVRAKHELSTVLCPRIYHKTIAQLTYGSQDNLGVLIGWVSKSCSQFLPFHLNWLLVSIWYNFFEGDHGALHCGDR